MPKTYSKNKHMKWFESRRRSQTWRKSVCMVNSGEPQVPLENHVRLCCPELTAMLRTTNETWCSAQDASKSYSGTESMYNVVGPEAAAKIIKKQAVTKDSTIECILGILV